ncbi:IPT/TIG domain-containing protein [Spirosoma sp. BT702]|uniref:IPT/TIG domain-containing protein n=1 Tax=Spirosoma profusum TaxID=2771354 RepID=A0A926Y2B7_9BACT|nr:IPT/TIG domain-containing protein [Spirosoma profusum]MBD2700820.1 IPT/TIG domain-containing protein [Spirosoma profusum]
MKTIISFFFLLVVFLGVLSCRVRNNPPELVSLSKSNELVGQTIVLTGYQFGSEPVVTFGVTTSAVTAAILSHDENTIQVQVPLIPPGRTVVQVRTSEGTSDPLPFIVRQPPPSNVVINPINGLPGTQVTITGNYLNQLSRIRFDEIDAVIKDSSATKITVVVPSTVPRGSRSFVVETNGGQYQFTTTFIVAGTPQITSLSTKKIKPGTELVIQGVNLTDGVVRINGLNTEKSQTTVKDTEIRTIVPPVATSGKVTVTVFEKLVATSTDSLLIIQPPYVGNLSAKDGIAGDKLILTGFNLTDVTAVTFNNTAVTFRVLSNTQIETTVPAFAAPTQVTISVSGIGGSAAATESFFYYVAPSNLTFSPARQVRSRAVTITGQNLHRVTDVRINGISVPISIRTEGSSLTVDVPTTGTSGPITVTNKAGTATTSTSLVVVQAPVVTDILPAKARPGDRVVLRGDFLLNAQIFFFGSITEVADGGKNTDVERYIIVPSTGQTGRFRIVNAAGEIFTETIFTVLRPITNLDISPQTGKVGDDIIIKGDNLASVKEIRFGNGTSAPAAMIGVDNTYKVTVPAGAVTGPICVINEAGTTCSTINFTVTK